MDYEVNYNGYWIEPDGTIHGMVEFQVHKEWMMDRHGTDWGVEHRYDIESHAQRRGWVEITFGMLRTQFAIEFDEIKVTNQAIASTRQILKDHDPDDPVHINDSLGFKDGHFPWRNAYVALAQFPRPPIKPRKLKTPPRGLSKRALASLERAPGGSGG